MTVQQLYDWAKSNNIIDKNIVIIKDNAHMHELDCYYEEDIDTYYNEKTEEILIY